MQFFRDSNFDFMGWRRVWLGLSAAFFTGSVIALFALGKLNVGIDFVGGTQLTLRFAERPDVEEIRSVLAGAGVGDALIQRFGGEDANEVMIKTPLSAEESEGSRDRVVRALESHFGESGGGFNLNEQGSEALTDLLVQADPDTQAAVDPVTGRNHYEKVAAAIMKVRQDDGLITSWDQIAGLEGLSDAARSTLQQRTKLGKFAVVGAENVGPQIGAELRTKGILAVLFSILGMLIYIWFRFELRFGVGAVVAIVHDVGVTLGLYALANYEFNLTTVAAFLTVVGYSVNDSVIIFDRVRENLRRFRRQDLESVLNTSINQTLSRTVLTSGTTLLAIGTLFLFGGEVIRGFAFVMLVGVVVGTYSTVFIASPVVLLWERWMGSRRRATA